VVLGDEVGDGAAVVKDLDAGAQFDVPLRDLSTWIMRRLAGGANSA
jgi:hypothetical protein